MNFQVTYKYYYIAAPIPLIEGEEEEEEQICAFDVS